MKKYLRHILIALAAFAVVLVLNFALPRLLPGDPVYLLTGLDTETLSADVYNRYYEALGLNLSLAEQFGNYLGDVFGGTLGYSYHYNATVVSLIAERLPATLQVVLPAVVISTLLALCLGMLAARKARKSLDSVLTAGATLLNAVPTFLIAMVLVIVFAFTLGALPYGNLSSPGVDPDTAQGFADRLAHLVLPVLTLVLATTPPKYMMLRSGAAKEEEEKYVLYARSRGLCPARVSHVHVFPNVGQPFLAMTGINFGAMLGGSVVTETIFSINGMGLLVSQAVTNLDYPVLQGCLTVISAFVLGVTAVTDLVLMLTDPAVRRRNRAY